MPTKPLVELKKMVGDSHLTVEGFHVEAGKVAEFVRAIKDDNPIYRDKSAAVEQGYDVIPAPLTFPRVSRFPRYQVYEDRRETDGYLGFDIGLRRGRALHGEQEYEYERPIKVGDTLAGTTTFDDVYQHEGSRGGTMTFLEFSTEYCDQSGDSVVTERRTVIETEGQIDKDGTDEDKDGMAIKNDDGQVGQSDVTEAVPDRLDASDVAVGDTGPEVVVEDVSRVDIVKYAGASGDFNRIHVDEPYARERGNPSVFAHGMFTAGVAAHMVADWFGLNRVDTFGVRFTSRVWPRDTITAMGKITDVNDSDNARRVSADVQVVNQNEEEVLTGNAIASLPEPT